MAFLKGPSIYDGMPILTNLPLGFDTFTILLDGNKKSDLNWSEAFEKAEVLIQNGYKIFWDLQLGLFNELSQPISNVAQFQCLKLSLEHFRKAVWCRFSEHSAGICLYRGNSDFNSAFKWGEKESDNFKGWLEQKFSSLDKLQEVINVSATSFKDLQVSDFSHCKIGKRIVAQFCQSASLDYLKLLAELLPNDAEPFALIEISNEFSLLDEAILRDTEQIMPLRLALQGNRLPLTSELAWNSGNSPAGFIGKTPLIASSKVPTLAVCMPKNILHDCAIGNTLETIFERLNGYGLFYKLIPEESLTAEWDGLDYLIVISKAVSPTCKRMLQGFCAACGTVVYDDAPLGLAHEMALAEFLKSL